MRYPGEVYFLPPDAAQGGDPKGRRHVLLTVCRDDADFCTFAYASTESTEAGYGAAYHLVDPFASRYRDTGFSEATYVYPSRLVNVGTEYIERLAGKLLDDMPLIREKLRQALGLGTGISAGDAIAAGSSRGTVALLSAQVAGLLDARAAIVVTEPRYSRARRHQVVVPILDAEDFDAMPDDLVLEMDLQPLGYHSTRVLLAVAMTQTVSSTTTLIARSRSGSEGPMN